MVFFRPLFQLRDTTDVVDTNFFVCITGIQRLLYFITGAHLLVCFITGAHVLDYFITGARVHDYFITDYFTWNSIMVYRSVLVLAILMFLIQTSPNLIRPSGRIPEDFIRWCPYRGFGI